MRSCTASHKSKHKLTYELVLDYSEAGVTGRSKENERAGSHAASRAVLENASLKTW